jgi:hypothetical protein
MRKTFAWIVGLALAANGVYMLTDPSSWYEAVPGVTATGPLNPHFVRDIGCIYLVIGASVIAFALDGRARSAALAGGAFLGLHALVHLWDAASGRETVHQLAIDLPDIFLPAVLVLWLAWPQSRLIEENPHAEMADPPASRRV